MSVGRGVLALLWLVSGCAGAAHVGGIGAGEGRGEIGDEIVVGGRRFSIGAPVVLWFEGPRYSGYDVAPRFGEEGEKGLRYQMGRTTSDEALARRAGAGDREALGEIVELFVLHYDACGTSRRCFEVLHDRRGLSVHFLLDVDGTIYQTLDAREQAWHARQANPRSVGVEIAQIGAYPAAERGVLEEWYGGEGRDVRPARKELQVGKVHGETYVQYDFTEEQYESLARLAAGLARALPGIEIDAPRDGEGRVRRDVLSDGELGAFRGVIGHQHVTEQKRDPGPAFDWERFLGEAREVLEGAWEGDGG